MRTYTEALALAGTKVPYSFAGGRTRYATWTGHGDDVSCFIYGNAVATFHPDDTVTIDAHGYHTASTVDAISYALRGEDYRHGVVKRIGGVVHYQGVPLIEPLTLDAAGEIVSADSPTQLDTAELAGEVRRGKRGASVALAGKVIVPQVRWSDDGIREDMSDARILEILLAGAR